MMAKHHQRLEGKTVPSDISKTALWWIITTQGAAVESWIRREIGIARTPSRVAHLERSLKIVQGARQNPAAFVDKTDATYGLLVEAYRIYARRRAR